MIIIRPVEILDAVLTATDVPEADAPEWLIGTSYITDDEVMVTTETDLDNNHSIFIALQASTGEQPIDDDLINPVFWARKSATNRWAMFSEQISDQTEQADSIEVELTPASLVNGIAMFGLDASSVHVVMDDPVEGVVYDETTTLVDASGVNDWYAWFFEPIVRQTTFAALDLPPFLLADITVTIEDTGGTAKCGLLTIGAQQRFGDTNYGTGVGIVDYSRKERDTFGNPVIVKRNFSKRADYNVTIDTSYASAIETTMANFRTTSLTWIGSVAHPSTIIYGPYRDFDITLQTTKSALNIEVEGLT